MALKDMVLDLLNELENDQTVDKAVLIKLLRTVVTRFDQPSPALQEDVTNEVNKPKKRQKSSKRMLDGKEVIAVLEEAPADGWTEAQIYEQGMKRGMPWPTTEETGLRYLSRRLSKDTKVYRQLANDRWILRRKIVPLKESAAE